MSVQRPTSSSAAATDHDEHLQLELTPIGSSSSSSWRRIATTTVKKKSKVEEVDEFTVPDVESRPPADAAGNGRGASHCDQSSAKRRRGRNPIDKEYKRIKRLLRNRVSAQQARERKKVYVTEMESRALELHDRNSKLEEKISTLTNENTMLRKILMNTRPKPDNYADTTNK